jgi:hypothetical protein
MKFMCIILSSAILLTGCYSHPTVTKDNILNLDNEELTFYLIDETYITSESGKHHRVEYGYKVVGKLYRCGERNWKDFDGMIGDREIKEITKSEYDDNLTTNIIVGTIAAVVVGVVLVTLSWSRIWML